MVGRASAYLDELRYHSLTLTLLWACRVLVLCRAGAQAAVFRCEQIGASLSPTSCNCRGSEAARPPPPRPPLLLSSFSSPSPLPCSICHILAFQFFFQNSLDSCPFLSSATISSNISLNSRQQHPEINSNILRSTGGLGIL